MFRDPGSNAGIETSSCGCGRISRQGIQRFSFSEKTTHLGLCSVESFRRELAQSTESSRRCEDLRLTQAFKRPVGILLKIRTQCGIGGVKALAENIARRFERRGFRAFEMFGDPVEGPFDLLVGGRLRYSLRRFQTWMGEQNFFEVILRGAVVAVRPVPFGCFSFCELVVDSGSRPPHVLR